MRAPVLFHGGSIHRMHDPFQEKTNAGDAPPRLESGLLLFRGRYEMVRELGAGGMGVVWLARDRDLKNVERALKFLPSARAWDKDDLNRLKNEVIAADALVHPRLLATKGFEHDPPYAAIVMEYVDGTTLKQRLARESKKFFEPEQIKAWVMQIVEALVFLHKDAGRMHRDVKPANVIVDKSGRAKLMDFGISEEIRHTISKHSRQVDLPSKTHSSHTLAYASPQQIRGEPSTEWDDVYGLGALIYDLLTGKPPFFRGDAVMVALQIENQAPPSIAKRRTELAAEQVIVGVGKPVDDRWEKLVSACLAKSSEDRPTLEELDTVLRGGPLPEVMCRASNRVARRQILKKALIGLGGVIALGSVVGLAIKDPEKEPQKTEPVVVSPAKLTPTPPLPPLPPSPRRIAVEEVQDFVRRYYEMCNEPGGEAGRGVMLADQVKFFDTDKLMTRTEVLAKDADYQKGWPLQTWKVNSVEAQRTGDGVWQVSSPFEFKLEDDFFIVSGKHLGKMKIRENDPMGLQIESIDATPLEPGGRRLKPEGFRQFIADYLASCKVSTPALVEAKPKKRAWDFFDASVSSYFTEISPSTGKKNLSREDIQYLETNAAEDSISRDFALAEGADFSVEEVKASGAKKSDVLYEVRYSVRFKVVFKSDKPPSENPKRSEYCRIHFKNGKPLITQIGHL
jgi:serine/threonine protein kinase